MLEARLGPRGGEITLPAEHPSALCTAFLHVRGNLHLGTAEIVRLPDHFQPSGVSVSGGLAGVTSHHSDCVRVERDARGPPLPQ